MCALRSCTCIRTCCHFAHRLPPASEAARSRHALLPTLSARRSAQTVQQQGPLYPTVANLMDAPLIAPEVAQASQVSFPLIFGPCGSLLHVLQGLVNNEIALTCFFAVGSHRRFSYIDILPSFTGGSKKPLSCRGLNTSVRAIVNLPHSVS